MPHTVICFGKVKTQRLSDLFQDCYAVPIERFYSHYPHFQEIIYYQYVIIVGWPRFVETSFAAAKLNLNIKLSPLQ